MNLSKAPPRDLELYDPELGLKRIAVAEAAEKHFSRAKDATQLMDAVELKLAEQRKFVLWWDQQEKQAGARGIGKAVALQTGNATLQLGGDGLPDRITVHRWRTKLKAEPRFLKTLESAQARCLAVCEATKGQTDQRGASGTNVNEWYTPKEYIAAARDVLGVIDLDPATSRQAQEWIAAARFFTKEDDGLKQEWRGRIWLNPPYMQPDIARFVEKLCVEVEAERTIEAILLTHNYTDTAWFHRAAGVCSAICFTRGRIAFLDPDGDAAAPTQGQAFFYFGLRPQLFRARFEPIGFVVTPA